ncbi:hypothetical protein A2982_00985 [candidate division WWE3 bacterium RIFCSPLOWO2_01_FULL_39_13]|uniref:Uncharacterized protein n=1 Tax=candidate division WWE3 bacterium RIFCSPLOWO2_01_FULL_39_13 TaxID=1802624 RepID=A0A1F4V5S6_UNCKA|nr:MAG: hypothetical protein A2982_00985 [candidate division WWE3 bacterium RIFCSPLOWO2_01_FULL_39_13]
MSATYTPRADIESGETAYERYSRLTEKYRDCISTVFFHKSKLTIYPVRPDNNEGLLISYRTAIDDQAGISDRSTQSLTVSKSEFLFVVAYFTIIDGNIKLNGINCNVDIIRQDLELVLGGFRLIEVLITGLPEGSLALGGEIIPDVVCFDEPTPNQITKISEYKDILEQLLHVTEEDLSAI